jgi:hypothetical protein
MEALRTEANTHKESTVLSLWTELVFLLGKQEKCSQEGCRSSTTTKQLWSTIQMMKHRALSYLNTLIQLSEL